MAARRRDRITALFFAVIFIGSSSILTVAIVIDNLTKKDETPATSQQATPPNNANKLQGTALKNFTPVASIATIQRIDEKPGNGTEVKTGDTVVADYTGALASTGVIFQSSLDAGQPATFAITPGGLIEGWVQKVPGMKVGGTSRLLIPAALAYGANPPAGSGIPPNADLVFDITIQSIGK